MATTGRIGWAGAAAAALGVNAVVLALLSIEGRRARTLRPPAVGPVLYLDIEPRAPLPNDRPSPAAIRRSSGPPSLAVQRASVPPKGSDEAKTPVFSAPIGARIDDQWRVTAGAGRPSDGLASCDTPHRLSAEARRRCDDRWTRSSQDPRAITGSGAPERDAVFARQGARRLAAWEAQRAEPPRGDPPCENPNPMSGCEGVNVSVELFSTRDGILPNLRKRRE